MKRFLQLSVLAAAALLSACMQDELSFQIEYDAIHGLTKGAPIQFEGTTVGRVEEIRYTDAGKFVVEVKVLEPFRALATQSSMFVVSEMQQSRDKVLEIVKNEVGDHSPILEDQRVQGADQVSALTQKLQQQLGGALQSLTERISNGLQNWQEQTLEQQITRIDSELDRILSEFDKLGAETRRKLETEIIPQLSERMEALKKELGELNRDEELDGLEKKMDDVKGLVEI